MSVPPFSSQNLSEGVGDDAHAVRDNRAHLLGALGLPAGHIAYATQVHGAEVRIVETPGPAGSADGLVAGPAGPAILVGTADCLGLLLWSRAGDRVAAVHAGWRGLAAGVVPNALETLARLGTDPSDLCVALGPRIGPCCFEVGPEVAREFPEWTSRSRNGQPSVDLAGKALSQITAFGVPAASVKSLDRCTACETPLWYSHRRDRGRTGRLWAIVACRPAGGRKVHERAV